MADLIGSLIVGNDTSLYQQAFNPASQVDAFRTLPRFSHNNDFSALFSSDDEHRDYIAGLLFVACLVMSFFTCWGLLLCLFKCLGPRHIGVFSGYPYQEPGWKATFGRVMFLISAILVMIFSILVVTKGLTPLEDTTDTIDATNQDVVKIHNEFIRITDNLKVVSREATPVRDQVVSFLKDDVCPLQPGSTLEQDVRRVGGNTLAALKQLSNFIEDDLVNVDEALRQVRKATTDVDTAIEDIKFTKGGAVAIMIPYFVVPALMLVALCFGWSDLYSDGYHFITTWILLPLFVIMIIFSYLACGFVVLAAEGNADFCSGGDPQSPSPEGTIQNILGQYNLTAGGLYHDALVFYTNQCTVDGPWGFLEGYYGDLQTAKTTLDEMSVILSEATPEQVSQECGVDYSPTLQLVTQLQTYTSILLNSSERSINLMSCQSIVPLYTNAVHEGTCDESIQAATWLFTCSFVISFFGMIMIMFRGAYYPYLFGDDGKSEYSTASDDDVGIEEDDSGEGLEEELDEYTSEYVDGSLFDTEASGREGHADEGTDQLGDVLRSVDGDEDTEFRDGESVEYAASQYELSQASESHK